MSKAIERERATPRRVPMRPGRFLWETFWTPFWLGSTMPPPPLPGRRDAPLSGERTPLIIRQLDTLRETIWRQRRAVFATRALWLALVAVDLWLGLRVLAHRDPSPRPFLAAITVIVILGAVVIALARPSRGQLARTLDRSYGLRERMATALEESQRERLTGVRALQVLEATRVARDVGTASAFRPRWPTRELVMAAITALVCVALLIVMAVRHFRPPVNGAANPTSAPAGIQAPGVQNGNGQQSGQQAGQNGQSQQGNQGGQQPGQGGQPSAQGQGDLDALANALRDHSPTRQAADKLANGDYAGAAQALRDAGNSASQLSSDTRQSLANDLKTASNTINDPQLSQDLRSLADKLTGSNPSTTQGAFNQVASDVERIGQGEQAGQQPGQQGQQGQQGQSGGQSPNGGGSGSGAGASPQLPNSQQSQDPTLGQSSPLLGADGKPIELPKGSQTGPQINTQNPNGNGNGQTDPGAAGAGGGQLRQGAVGDSGVDPNQVPYDQRGAVERYFTPSSGDQR